MYNLIAIVTDGQSYNVVNVAYNDYREPLHKELNLIREWCRGRREWRKETQNRRDALSKASNQVEQQEFPIPECPTDFGPPPSKFVPGSSKYEAQVSSWMGEQRKKWQYSVLFPRNESVRKRADELFEENYIQPEPPSQIYGWLGLKTRIIFLEVVAVGDL